MRKTSELIGSSPHGFEDATRAVVARAHRTLRGIRSVSVVEKRIRIMVGTPDEYRVRLELHFDVAPATDDLHW